MAVSCTVAGDFLEVTRDGETVRLSLSVPLDRLSTWLDFDGDMGFWDLHAATRDSVMGEDAAEWVRHLESVDAVDAVQVSRDWSTALGGRLGKVLSLPSSGETTEQPSPPTSGSDSE